MVRAKLVCTVIFHVWYGNPDEKIFENLKISFLFFGTGSIYIF